MELKEFHRIGYLHEVNRLFLHPLGMSLSWDKDKDVLTLVDDRDDPEGVVFSEVNPEKTLRVYEDMINRALPRIKALGFWHQPSLEPEASEKIQRVLLQTIGILKKEDLIPDAGTLFEWLRERMNRK